jgi:hypothetical protein
MNDDQAFYLKIVPARPASPLDLDVQSFLLDCQARNLSANTLHNDATTIQRLFLTMLANVI